MANWRKLDAVPASLVLTDSTGDDVEWERLSKTQLRCTLTMYDEDDRTVRATATAVLTIEQGHRLADWLQGQGRRKARKNRSASR